MWGWGGLLGRSKVGWDQLRVNLTDVFLLLIVVKKDFSAYHTLRMFKLFVVTDDFFGLRAKCTFVEYAETCFWSRS
jgi:hypothetical protein